MLEQFENIGKQALGDLKQVNDVQSLEQFRLKYLSRKGLIIQMLSQVVSFHPTKNLLRARLQIRSKRKLQRPFEQTKAAISQSQQAKAKNLIDVTLPGKPVNIGKKHIITQTTNELLEIFGRMGFSVAYGPEVEDEWHNFIALNIPPDHPARDPLDNFYISDNTLLRSQTSTIQIRVMEKTNRLFELLHLAECKPDTVDATHMFMFHQLEALVVDEGVTMIDMKTPSSSSSMSFSVLRPNGDSGQAFSHSQSQAQK